MNLFNRKILNQRIANYFFPKDKELNELIVSANQLLSKEYDFEKEFKITELGWNEFIEQFEKQKIKLTLDQKEELQKWFRMKQKERREIQDKITELDESIDNEVYKLYGLTKEEIKLIEEER